MDLSIIIVNWNSASYVQECISSVRSSVQGLEYEIIVVDNASTDNSVEILESFRGVLVVRSVNNIGFARANNLGFTVSSGKAVLFLNPDTKVLENAIAHTYAALLSSPSVGIVGCRLLNSDLSVQTSCIQSFPTVLNQFTDIEKLRMLFPRTRMFGVWPLFDEKVDPLTPVDAVSGAYLMIRRDIFEKVGGFTTDYFMYAEDIDLCHKVKKAGSQVCYVADARVVHYGGQSTKQRKDNGFGEVATRQAIYTFLAKTRGHLYARVYRSTMCFSAVIRLFLVGALGVVAFDRSKKETLALIARKWKRILRWSVGLENWVKDLGASVPKKPQLPIPCK